MKWGFGVSLRRQKDIVRLRVQNVAELELVRWNRHAMQELRQYKIFIASPNGLEAERNKLREEVQFYSKNETEREGLTFSVVRYEDNAASFGNPQDGINPYLCECDFFVLVFIQA